MTVSSTKMYNLWVYKAFLVKLDFLQLSDQKCLFSVSNIYKKILANFLKTSQNLILFT